MSITASFSGIKPRFIDVPNTYLSSKHVVQSALLTKAFYDFNVYEMRILYRIIELIQKDIENQSVKQGVQILPNFYADFDIRMSFNHFVVKSDNNYHKVRKAFNRLSGTVIEVKFDKNLLLYNVVERVNFQSERGKVEFRISGLIYRLMLNFSKGFDRYNLNIVFSLSSTYAMRFYQLLCGSNLSSITFSIKRLREIFKLENRYSRTSDLIKYVIESAKKHLDASQSPVTFDYQAVKDRRGSIQVVEFTIIRRLDPGTNKLPKISLMWDINRNFFKVLSNVSPKLKIWNPHRELLLIVQKTLSTERILKIIDYAVNNAENPVGYVIEAFKKELEKKGVLVGGEKEKAKKTQPELNFNNGEKTKRIHDIENHVQKLAKKFTKDSKGK